MKQQIWKPVLTGLAIGTLLYFTPFFLFRGFLFFLLIATIFRLFLFRRGWWPYRAYHGGFDPAFADSIRNMSPEEYEQFRNRNFHYDDCSPRTKDQKPD